MSQIITFFKDSYVELVHKVTWPKYGELSNSSILVLVSSLIFALLIGVIDLAFDNAVTWFYNEF
ncbi:preprotein translocase subunit SecE [Cyclobacteriaceae bacterium]|nr:preprotein translocase subunit SecE [Cyclobacteriaceae bacterium]MDB4316417.1 preprotein translocase subunit SecE [Cyclobacteriaceae bacterium]MDC1369179.1 preprotein translocase subunit SecE [Cyclobacteriaceae bacterium]